ncbi:MAG TPA: cytochrome c biogenesis CcdA family protein [Candidatus Saccharimonadales bacterium]|nr:cytochrome c biogenesis CcdA family protein [Candidatus Saccharimonadales bacterium]
MAPPIDWLAVVAPHGDALGQGLFAGTGTDLTFMVAVAAGLISFLSPCVLPLVPAYLGQLTAVAVASSAAGGSPSRWLAVRHAIAYVAGFGLIFTLLGVTATFAAGPLVDYLPVLRQIGGVILIVLGLNLAGLVPIAMLQRVWRPLDAGASASIAGMTGTVALAGGPNGSGRMDRVGQRIVGQSNGWLASFGLGAIFAIGWTPCIGTILGGILGLAATSGTAVQGAVLLVGYTIGLGVPFLVLGALYDRAPAILSPLVRHGRLVSLIGGALVVAIGVAMLMGWLALLPGYFQFNTAI